MKFNLFILIFSLANFVLAKDICHTGENLSVFNVKESFGAEISNLIDPPKLKYKGFLAPSDLRRYGANTLAELLIDRIQEGCDKVRGGNSPKSIGDQSEVMMMVNDHLFDSIDKYGFQNQHVTATTEGCDCRDNRYRAEMTMLGNNVGYSSKAKNILPKYSGLNILVRAHSRNSANYNGATRYGNVAVIFKKYVNERTTFTPWDSLDTRDFRGSPTLSSLSFKDHSIDSGKFQCSGSYCEAQLWGELSLDDVAYVLISKGEQVPEALKKRGIPVYYKRDGKEGTMSWEKDELAYPYTAVKNGYSPAKIAKDCEGCSSVTSKINMHHNFSSMQPDELLKLESSIRNTDVRREVLGELAVKNFKNKKKFFEKKLSKSRASLNDVIYMQALSEFPDSKSLRDKLLSEFSPYGGARSASKMMAISIAAELPRFKADKEVQDNLAKFLKATRSDYLRQFYQYLTTDKNMCSDLK